MELLLLGLIGFGAFSFFMDDVDESPTAQRGSASTGDNATPPPPQDPITDRTFELESGVANPTGTSGNDTFTGIVEGDVLGGAGDDTFDFENGYGAEVFGGAGNDTLGPAGDAFTLHGDEGDDLIALSASFFDGATAYGGAGNDTFNIAFPESDVYSNILMSGGSGVDTFNLSFTADMPDEPNAERFAQIEDFRPGTDKLNIDVENFTKAELVENADQGHTDLLLHYFGVDEGGSPIDRIATVRLMGVSGATLGSLGVTLPVPADNSGQTYLIDPGGLGFVNGGIGNDTITGIASGTFRGGGGDDSFLIEDGADSLIDGGAGNDIITVDAGANLTILGGDGNDTFDIDSTSNIQEISTIDAGAGQDSIGVGIALSDPSISHVDTVIGGEGADLFALNVTNVLYANDFSADQMLTIADFSETEDEIVVKLTPEDSPFFTGAQLVEDAQGGWTDLVLTFQKTDSNGVVAEWTGSIRLLETSGLVLADDGPIWVPAAA
ncbi:MAG: hypothetical protein O9328_06550 [Rhodobacteraceae bacterium]|nr:hypothetical protein [Paracoccaceae bacterium]